MHDGWTLVLGACTQSILGHIGQFTTIRPKQGSKFWPLEHREHTQHTQLFCVPAFLSRIFFVRMNLVLITILSFSLFMTHHPSLAI